jgi:phage/conjugal plasmid C-4 type zinc finger TraR family protein
MDEFDAAQACDEQLREIALRNAAQQRATLAGAGRDDCEDCGEPIPARRRQVLPGATRCVDRQSRFDRTHR